MTLKEAIKWHEDKEAEYKVLAKEHEDFAMMAVHYQQLAGWLKEVETLREDVEMWSKDATSLQLSYNELLVNYKKAKQLLKAAVEDFVRIDEVKLLPENTIHPMLEYTNIIDIIRHKWRYADEVEKLLKDNELIT